MPTPKPTAKADIDPKYEKILRAIKEHAQSEADQRRKGEGVRWFRPTDFTGGEFDFGAMSAPFSRQKANDDYKKSVQDASAPGVSGDIVATTTMIDCLSVMERAFRQRHTMRRVRATAHMAGRKKGQGNDKGPFVQNYLEYIRSVVKQSKG